MHRVLGGRGGWRWCKRQRRPRCPSSRQVAGAQQGIAALPSSAGTGRAEHAPRRRFRVARLCSRPAQARGWRAPAIPFVGRIQIMKCSEQDKEELISARRRTVYQVASLAVCFFPWLLELAGIVHKDNASVWAWGAIWLVVVAYSFYAFMFNVLAGLSYFRKPAFLVLYLVNIISLASCFAPLIVYYAA